MPRVHRHRLRVTGVAAAAAILIGAVAEGAVADRGSSKGSDPEPKTGARGRAFQGTHPDGSVLGFADGHLHITAEMRAGGRVIHGRSFSRFGVARALGGDERDHGPDGSLDVTGNLLRTGLPFGTHDTHGWSTFKGWPTHDTNTHQQTYWVWLKRAWQAGERLVVAQTIEDEPICRIQPRRSHPCDETKTIELEIRRLRALERYVDARSGGRGRGWFRLVYSPRQARRVIEDGKLAVAIGIESSNPFGCSQRLGEARCTRADIDHAIHRYRRLGVRSMFVAHWVDNALAGAALEGGAGDLHQHLQPLSDRPLLPHRTVPPAGRGGGGGDAQPGRARGPGGVLPSRGAAGRRADAHLSARQAVQLARAHPAGPLRNTPADGEAHADRGRPPEREARREVLAMAERNDYPLVSSHNGTGGAWTPKQLERLYALGGFASVTPDTAQALAGKILRQRRFRSRDRYFGVGLGTDTGGFSSLPVPRPTPRPTRWVIRSGRTAAAWCSDASEPASGSST